MPFRFGRSDLAEGSNPPTTLGSAGEDDHDVASSSSGRASSSRCRPATPTSVTRARPVEGPAGNDDDQAARRRQSPTATVAPPTLARASGPAAPPPSPIGPRDERRAVAVGAARSASTIAGPWSPSCRRRGRPRGPLSAAAGRCRPGRTRGRRTPGRAAGRSAEGLDVERAAGAVGPLEDHLAQARLDGPHRREHVAQHHGVTSAASPTGTSTRTTSCRTRHRTTRRPPWRLSTCSPTSTACSRQGVTYEPR